MLLYEGNGVEERMGEGALKCWFIYNTSRSSSI